MTTRYRMIALTYVAVTALITGCGGQDPAPASQPTPTTPASTPVVSSSPEPDQDSDGIPDASDPYPTDPLNEAPRSIVVTCGSQAFEVTVPAKSAPDFRLPWAAKAASCDSDTVTPTTALENAAHKASGYEDADIGTLYAICAAIDPEDVYASAGFVASPGQVQEINAALMLCPKHPQATKWRQAVQRGKAEQKLEAQGRLFGSGTFLVGKEIKAGRYVATDVKGCYWERQSKSGATIDNDFLISARRVEVTIRSSDYAFHSQSCGEWRPR